MWKLLEIAQQTSFIYCNLENTQDVHFILYDLKTTWCQTVALQNVKKNVKLLNKRFDFNEDNIKDALIGGEIQSAILEHGSSENSCLLKLKYHVKNCLLSYEWTLRKQNLIEFQQTFVQPLLISVLDCYEQVNILTDSIRKKDLELKQYRIEGAVLNRKTLITKPFDLENFSKKYENCNKTAIIFRELAKYVKENGTKDKTDASIKLLNLDKIEEEVNPNEILKEHENANTKMSPRQRKRKVHERKLEHLEQHLKLRKRGLEYESSQSQTASSGNSPAIEEPTIKDLKYQTRRRTTEVSKSEIISPSRRSSRHTNTVQYFISSDDNTDIDIEDNVRTVSPRKVTRSLDNLSKDVNKNCNKDQTIPISKIDKAREERKQKCVKSLSLSNTSRTNSPKNIAETNKTEKDLLALKVNNTSVLALNSDCEGTGNIFPGLECISTSSPSQKSLSNSPTPVIINEISSQLDNIKKELETLEAMRLADLKQRICKA